MRGGGSEIGDMRIGMRHRPELGNQQRDRGDDRDAKLESMEECSQGGTRMVRLGCYHSPGGQGNFAPGAVDRLPQLSAVFARRC